MHRNNPHIIQTQRIEVLAPSKEEAVRLQQELTEIYYQTIVPRLDKLFSTWAGPDEHLRFDRIEIEWNVESVAQLIRLFSEQFVQRLEEKHKQLQLAPNKGVTQNPEIQKKQSGVIAVRETFFHFLLTGHLPWWANTTGARGIEWTESLLACMDENPAAFFGELKSVMAKHPSALNRLVHQLPNSLLDKLLDSMSDVTPTTGMQPAKDKSTDFPISPIQPPSKETYTNRFIHKFGLEHGDTPLSASKPAKTALPDDDARYLQLAGLVLLHPFLPAFFQALNLLDASGKQFRDSAAQERAIHLLYYLGAGATEPPEYELELPKLLCGLPLEEPVARYINLTEQETTEANTLLQSVITHWQVLKNTSPAGLREAFLQRDGKLSRMENGWKLLVERKAQDVLLGRLPWGIGVVKLPWMGEMVWVEW